MMEKIKLHLAELIKRYTSEEYYEDIKSARREYFGTIGQLREEEENFESQICCFDDWYLFNYPLRGGLTPVQDYLKDGCVEDEFRNTFEFFRHSLFEFRGKGFRGNFTLQDLLSGEKISLVKDHPSIPLMKGEIFVGRVLSRGVEHFLLRGVTPFPDKISSRLIKRAQQVRKHATPAEKNIFVNGLESVRIKWLEYGRPDPERFFVLE
jgi:hypothetical protein